MFLDPLCPHLAQEPQVQSHRGSEAHEHFSGASGSCGKDSSSAPSPGAETRRSRPNSVTAAARARLPLRRRCSGPGAVTTHWPRPDTAPPGETRPRPRTGSSRPWLRFSIEQFHRDPLAPTHPPPPASVHQPPRPPGPPGHHLHGRVSLHLSCLLPSCCSGRGRAGSGWEFQGGPEQLWGEEVARRLEQKLNHA